MLWKSQYTGHFQIVCKTRKSAEPAINRPMIIHYIRPAECTENQWNVVCKWQE